jgi:c-di-GMP phosphodiesterase
VFEFTDRNRQRQASPEPAALAWMSLGWQPLVGRDRRPIGARLTIARHGQPASEPALSELLDGVLAGLVTSREGEEQFPHGLLVLSARGIEADGAMSSWSAPRNVLLEAGQCDLEDEQRLRQMFEIQRQGVRLVLRLDQPGAPPVERLSGFAYVLTSALPPPVDPKEVSILTLDVDTHHRAEAAFAGGAHAVVGWPLAATQRREPRGLSPAQTAVFELIRLVQADADVRDLERVFRAEPLLAYLLLTLANSAAFRRPAPVSSLGHAISLLGYQRLIKWLVLLLAISGKDKSVVPLVFIAVARGYLMENLSAAAQRSRAQQDDAFVVGAFSLLDRITGQSIRDLLLDVNLPDPVEEALLAGTGPYAALLNIAARFEAADPMALVAAQAELQLQSAQANRALLQALAMADALQSLI